MPSEHKVLDGAGFKSAAGASGHISARSGTDLRSCPPDGHGRHWAARTLEADELCGYSNLLDGQRPHPSQHVRNLTGNVSIAVGGYPEVERDLPRVETSLWVNLHRQPGGSALHAAQHDDAGQQQNRSHCGLKRHDQIHVPRTFAKPRQP